MVDAFILRESMKDREAERDLSVHIVDEISLEESKTKRRCFGSVTLDPIDVRAIELANLNVVRDPEPEYKASVTGLPNPKDNRGLAYLLASILAEIASREW